MAEIQSYTFSYKEIATTLVKAQGLHEGIWQLQIKFGISGANIGPSDDDLKPSAIVPILSIGLARMAKENNLSVDASKVNPA